MPHIAPSLHISIINSHHSERLKFSQQTNRHEYTKFLIAQMNGGVHWRMKWVRKVVLLNFFFSEWRQTERMSLEETKQPLNFESSAKKQRIFCSHMEFSQFVMQASKEIFFFGRLLIYSANQEPHWSYNTQALWTQEAGSLSRLIRTMRFSAYHNSPSWQLMARIHRRFITGNKASTNSDIENTFEWWGLGH